ncbi:GAF domain-containing protein [Streptomyces sp. SLBN-118]|uniref:ATP-binding protein n=1 Tax=Streptomyces sp. SLBN-118 TaxID=2768454 RepID=UPI001153FD21|nr:ATP-binding protein [Streptomyces sp. SLBN-118]TQK44077.1 GAF domain-containing protein [Streptomyces sp. SLBN-118]
MSGRRGRGGDSVTRRLGIAFSVMTGLILLVGAGVLTATFIGHGASDEIVDRTQPALADNLRLHGEASDMQRSMRGYLLTGDQKLLDAYRAARQAYPAVLASALEHGDPATDRNLRTQAQQLQAYVRIADQQAGVTQRSEQAARLTREGAVRYNAFAATNHELEVRLSEDVQRMDEHADRIVRVSAAWVAGLLLAALGATVFTSLRTTRALVRPLKSVEYTLGLLTAGEYSARAVEHGPAEIRAVARSVNTLADEGDRLREIEDERRRLSEIARQVGIRIRERLDVDEVLDTACAGIGEGLEADHVFILLTQEDSQVVPVVRAWSAEQGLLSARGLQALPPIPSEVVRDHYRRGATWSIDNLPEYLSAGVPLPDAPGSFGRTGLPEENRDAARSLGLYSVVMTPIGVGEEPLGAVCLSRSDPEHVWHAVEIDIAESMATGVGRALHNSMLYGQEASLVEKLRALDRAKSDFLSTVSHELRTPLTSIVGYVELLTDDDTGPLTEPQRRMLDVIDRNANRLRSLIEDLLTLSRIESGAFTSQREDVDLSRLVSSAVDAMRPAAEAASVRLETDCPEEPLVLEADSDQLDRVLMNLLSNAVKFTPTGGEVRVRAAREDGEVILSVSDTGIGIPKQECQQLFSRFFRASNAVDQAIPGTGLGLTIVQTIVTNHGGTTEVTSEEGRGTTVTARMPLVTAGRTAQTVTDR